MTDFALVIAGAVAGLWIGVLPGYAFPAEQTAHPLSPEEPSLDSLGQITAVEQLRDVQPTDWAYQAAKQLVERHNCLAGYPGGLWRGDRPLSRYEFAAGINACLEQLTLAVDTAALSGVEKNDLDILQRLNEQFVAELREVRSHLPPLEQRTETLATQEFSTTTKLFGQAVIGLRGSNNNGVDLFPQDGIPERRGSGTVTLGGEAELTLATSFTGQDLLLTTLKTGNLSASAPTQFTNMGRLATETDLDNRWVLGDLSYRFAATPNLGLIVGPLGVNPVNTFRGLNPLEDSGNGALSLLAQRNPVLSVGNGTGGIGFDWQMTSALSLQGIYSAELPSLTRTQAGRSAGLIGGRYATGLQLAAGLGEKLDAGVHYLYSASPDGFLGNGVGDNQLLSPFAPATTGFTTGFTTHAVGGSLNWRVTPRWTVGGWGGWTRSTPTRLSGVVETTNWMAYTTISDVFQSGGMAGLLVGQPPRITSSTLPAGFNFPKFSDGGEAGGREGRSLHLETFYRAPITPNLSVTPGLIVVLNPNHNPSNETLVVGALRTTLRF